jgi:hypothetical protein
MGILLLRGKLMENTTKYNNRIIKQIVEDYRKAYSVMLRNGNLSMAEFFLNDSNGKTDMKEILEHLQDVNICEEEKVILQIIFCLSIMDDTGREIIWKEFFNKSKTTSKIPWWEGIYSRSTFYRLKNQYVKQFINLCAAA